MRWRSLAWLIVLTLAVGIACSPERDPSGAYKASDTEGGNRVLRLDIKSDGKGTWKVDGDDMAFTWEIRGEELWLHARSGGVIRGRIEPDGSIRIPLPHVGTFHFERTEP